jgi:cation:H+ antiporter
MPVWLPLTEPPGDPPRRRVAPPRARPADGESTRGTVAAGLPPWQLKLASLAACVAPAVLLRLSGVQVPPPLGLLVFGGAVMAAAFMLAAAAEAAELDAPPGVAVAGIAFVAVLPEFVIEVYFAFTGQIEYVSASLTGATRLLLTCAVGMPAIASLVLGRGSTRRLRTVTLDRARRVDLAIIAAASLYAPLIALRGRLVWQDALVLIGLYVVYLRRVSTGRAQAPHLVGIAAELGALPKQKRRRWVLGIMGAAACGVLLTAEPFAHNVLLTGTTLGISPYLLVQSLVPLATEMPELVISFVLIRHKRPGQAVAVLLASSVSQWTLALGTLPLAYVAGAGHGPLPLYGREVVELLLTVGQALLAVAVLVTLRLERRDAVLMLVLFAVQAALPSLLIRAALTVVYVGLAIDILVSERWAVRTLADAFHGRG